MRKFLLLGLFLAAGTGCISTRTGPFKPASVPVPPSQEIELLDPGQSTTGVPAVQTVAGIDGVNKVEIPPTVLVHRYYPSGDRSFQGPMLPGGPMIVAANHPRTMERTYVNLTLPPGAPRVVYSGKSIVYDYGPQSVTVHFGPCGATVKYSQGIQIVESVRDAKDAAVEKCQDFSDRAGIGQGLKNVGTSLQGFGQKAADRIAGLRPNGVPAARD